jgi:hypothetical protein
MASVKTGAGRARARAGRAMGGTRGTEITLNAERSTLNTQVGKAAWWRRAFTLIFATTGWSQKGAQQEAWHGKQTAERV